MIREIFPPRGEPRVLLSEKVFVKFIVVKETRPKGLTIERQK